jgi:hypothetical protein
MLVYRKSATTIGTLLWIIRLVLVVTFLSINDAYWGEILTKAICFSDQNSNGILVLDFLKNSLRIPLPPVKSGRAKNPVRIL